MKNILLIISVFATFAINAQDIYNTIDDDHTVVINSDTLMHITDTCYAYTNANYVTGSKAFQADSASILDSLEGYEDMLPVLPDEGYVTAGEVYTYDSESLRVIQSHERSTVAHYDPHDLPALYLFREISGCPDWVQPTGSHDAYNIDDCVTFEGSEYVSLIDANVWSPSVYPAGWQLQ